jgi:putative hydrolase of HD superfamily
VGVPRLNDPGKVGLMTDIPRSRLLEMLLQAGRLKTTPRTGWHQRGVPAPESVADHSHGVALIALALLDSVPLDEASGPLDRARVLAMAISHDLAESVTGDLSLGASRLLPPGAKAAAESAALDELLDGLGFAAGWRSLWAEFESQATPEARLVRDADRLDLLATALSYELSTGTRSLEEFWSFAPDAGFTHETSRELARGLRERRP